MLYNEVDTAGSSMIDFVLYITKMHPRITVFQIGSNMPESDHNPVTFSSNSPVVNIVKYKTLDSRQ